MKYLDFIAISFAVAISPGPSWAAVIDAASRGGQSLAGMTILGNALGILTHGVAVALGAAELAAQSPRGLFGLRAMGAAYLLWLAYRAAPLGATPTGAHPRVTKSKHRWPSARRPRAASRPQWVTRWTRWLEAGGPIS